MTNFVAVHNLNYNIHNTRVNFDKLSVSFTDGKYGICGDNGVGKSTFLNLISGMIPVDDGEININGTILYCKQNSGFDKNSTVAELLGVKDKLDALSRIEAGSIELSDFNILQDDWLIRENIQSALKNFALDSIDPSTPLSSLSGGQITKIELSKIFLYDRDIILLDEPTNNLDDASREILYNTICSLNKLIIIVTHDRKLLNNMDYIIELSGKGLTKFTGNYSHYLEYKKEHDHAMAKKVSGMEKELKKAKKLIQANLEKQQQKKSKGSKDRKSGGQSKIILDAQKSKSEKSDNKLNIKSQRIVNSTQSSLNTLKDKIETTEEMKLNLESTKIGSSKVILEINNLSFSYLNENKVIDDFQLTLVGPERISINGTNGSGKTTLLKLIMGQLKPNKGNIYRGTNNISYLDQHVAFLNNELTIKENFSYINPDLSDYDIYQILASFNFRNENALKLVGCLSGGERIRAGLAYLFASKKPPQLLILDEPTNHLDISSITCIENALNQYHGAMIVVSHDEVFLNNIQINKAINLS